MPTHEERLETVEYGLKQFQTETIKAYTDVVMELAMLKGLTEDAIKRLMILKKQTDERFDRVDQQLTEIKQDTSQLHMKFNRLEQRLNSVDQRFASLEGKLEQILQILTTPPKTDN